ncbi:respiratory-chain nadh dehydrogenase domain 51 kda subunit [Lasius niger]|uniref:Respiratory-chain nadh dehydrogenase domain 51 kDa subunit n=1 Tax=Lasius niger TaxID=67767 RepID=A0A0J7LBI9_LASNI|nr:respiratory-chain nadh dehydrogenase domain 51 kda subunit [Lasius niger]
METHGPGYTLGHTLGNMADLTLLSFCLALDKGVDHLARGFRKDYPEVGEWERARDTEGNPMGLRLCIL